MLLLLAVVLLLLALKKNQHKPHTCGQDIELHVPTAAGRPFLVSKPREVKRDGICFWDSLETFSVPLVALLEGCWHQPAQPAAWVGFGAQPTCFGSGGGTWPLARGRESERRGGRQRQLVQNKVAFVPAL